MSTLSHLSKSSRLAVATLALFALTAPAADARVGGGFSTGSRGFKTYTPPPATKTAPGAVQGDRLNRHRRLPVLAREQRRRRLQVRHGPRPVLAADFSAACWERA
jgi:hypothetical protein